jgi:hypothetical protein
VDETVASERNDVGLCVAPTRERLCPLPRATEIEHRLAQGDDLTVGDSREHRRNLVGCDRDHGLVQQRRALADSSLQDQRVPAAEPREHRRVGIREALGKLPRLNEALTRVSVSFEQPRQGREHLQPGLLDAVATAVLQEPATTGDPAHRRGQVAAEEEAERLPERTACRAPGVAAAQPGVVGTDPRLFASVVSPDHVGGKGKALEILSVQLPLAMSPRQLGECVTPHPTLERAGCSLFSVGHSHPLHDMPRRATSPPTRPGAWSVLWSRAVATRGNRWNWNVRETGTGENHR